MIFNFGVEIINLISYWSFSHLASKTRHDWFLTNKGIQLRFESARDAHGKQFDQIINHHDDVKFIPRTPEMEDLGVIRKTKHVAFLDSVMWD